MAGAIRAAWSAMSVATTSSSLPRYSHPFAPTFAQRIFLGLDAFGSRSCRGVSSVPQPGVGRPWRSMTSRPRSALACPHPLGQIASGSSVHGSDGSGVSVSLAATLFEPCVPGRVPACLARNVADDARLLPPLSGAGTDRPAAVRVASCLHVAARRGSACQHATRTSGPGWPSPTRRWPDLAETTLVSPIR